jgi:N-acetylglutamate synthase-like GNAT family acetyltransferase
MPTALDNGLLLRQATTADQDAIAAFVSIWLHESLGVNASDLCSGRHPSSSASDFVVVSDPAQGDELVATAGLIHQRWWFDDVSIKVGTPEFVATHEAYRHRGLMTAVLDALHTHSYAQGNVLQAVAGIPYFYRKLGYEYALERDDERDFDLAAYRMTSNLATPYRVRRMTTSDVGNALSIYEHYRRALLVSTVMDSTRWQYDLTGHSDGSDIKMRHYCIIDGDDNLVGYYKTWGDDNDDYGAFFINEIGIAPHAALHDVFHAICAALQRHHLQLTGGGELERFKLSVGHTHPVYQTFAPFLTRAKYPTSWYVRVNDLATFLKQIAPVLARRLDMTDGTTNSTLLLDFYTHSLRLRFVDAQLVEVEPPLDGNTTAEHTVHLPQRTFLKLLFGYRSLDELLYADPDVVLDDKTYALLKRLFPKHPSRVLYLG